MPNQVRLWQIDDSTRGDHSYILPSDNCYYFFEYTSRKGYDYSNTNQLISNLKKKPSCSGQNHYRYKGQAVSRCATLLAGALNHDWLKLATLVPVPPSKIRGHLDFDDRIAQICQAIPVQFPLDVRELVIQRASTEAFHAGDEHRRTVDDLKANYRIDEAKANPTPTRIAIVDDVLTAGTHFRAMHQLLTDRFPRADICGIFIARRVFPDDDDQANPFDI